MKRILCVTMGCFILSACVKLEVKPENVVANTVEAGKEFYATIKQRRNGEEERVYSHTVRSDSQSQDADALLACNQQLRTHLSQVSLSRILSESSSVIEHDKSRKIKCETVALIKP